MQQQKNLELAIQYSYPGLGIKVSESAGFTRYYHAVKEWMILKIKRPIIYTDTDIVLNDTTMRINFQYGWSSDNFLNWLLYQTNFHLQSHLINSKKKEEKIKCVPILLS